MEVFVAFVRQMDDSRDMETSTLTQQVSTKVVGPTTYVTHTVDSLDTGRRIADAICTQSMLPVYFGTGYAVDRAHIQRLDYGSELVLRFFPAGEDRSGSTDDYTTVHSFRAVPKPEPDMTDDPQYQAWVESMAKHCRCSSDRPCAGVLAGGLCDDLQDDPCDDDRVSLAYEQDDSDPMGLGGI